MVGAVHVDLRLSSVIRERSEPMKIGMGCGLVNSWYDTLPSISSQLLALPHHSRATRVRESVRVWVIRNDSNQSALVYDHDLNASKTSQLKKEKTRYKYGSGESRKLVANMESYRLHVI